MANNKSIHAYIPDPEKMVKVGSFWVGRSDDDHFWIENEHGEGTQVEHKHAEKFLKKLWEASF